MPSLAGVWKLVDARAFDEAGREVPSPLGPHPMGGAIIDAERIMAMGSDGRAELPPETKRAFVAYCGRYTFDGTKLITRVDGASSPDMMEDRVRHIGHGTPSDLPSRSRRPDYQTHPLDRLARLQRLASGGVAE